MRNRGLSRVAGISLVLVVGMVATACSSTPKTTSTTKASTTTTSAGPNVTLSSFTSDFSVMSQFKAIAAAGKGKVAAILPDTVSSTRYVEFDAPDITKALADWPACRRLTSWSRTPRAATPPS